LQDAHPLLWHYGDTMGFKTAIFRYIDDDLSVIVLCNRTDVDPGALALEAAQMFLTGNKSAVHWSRIEVPVRYCDRKESAILTDIAESSHSRRGSGQCLLLAADLSGMRTRLFAASGTKLGGKSVPGAATLPQDKVLEVFGCFHLVNQAI
jgi:hypothetical protein